MPLFPTGAIDRLDKKVSRGKKITSQEAMKAALEMRHMFGAAVVDLQKMAEMLQQHGNAFNQIFANLECLLQMLVRKEVFTMEEYTALFKEVILKPQEDAMAKAKQDLIDKMKKEGAEAAVASTENNNKTEHPDCHYCGKDDCVHCNPPKVECCSSDDTECTDCQCQVPEESVKE